VGGQLTGVPEVPAGFEPLFRSSPFVDLLGPLYSRGRGADFTLGLYVQAKHCNARGSVHGGVMATLADIALGYAIAYASDPPLSLVTASLALDFAGNAQPGDWLEARVDVQKTGSRLAFANCYIWAAGQRVVRASASFAVMNRGA
jgi:acyl-coenzyme A thioesterase 13